MTTATSYSIKSRAVRAKRAQAKRLGAGGVTKKKCKVGKSCGSSCINNSKICLVDLPIEVGSQLTKTRTSIENGPYTIRDSSDNPAKVNIKRILNELREEPGAVKTDGFAKEKEVKWGASLSHGAHYVGGGVYGSFVTVSANELVKDGERRFPGGIGVKAGEIGRNEVEAIRKAGEAGIGPRLIAARVSSIEKLEKSFPEGVIAMSKVPGVRLSDMPAGSVPGGTSGRAVMEAAARLHRLGISHNDMHGGNIYIDSSGKARFVDFGLARMTPKHALAEAMRQFGSLGNMDQVEQRLRQLRVTDRQISRMKVSFGSYVSGGGWDKITDSQAMSLINLFYEGTP